MRRIRGKRSTKMRDSRTAAVGLGGTVKSRRDSHARLTTLFPLSGTRERGMADKRASPPLPQLAQILRLVLVNPRGHSVKREGIPRGALHIRGAQVCGGRSVARGKIKGKPERIRALQGGISVFTRSLSPISGS